MDDQHAIEDLAVPEDRLGYTTISFSTTERWPSLANVVAICRLRVCHRFYMCSRTCKQTRGKYIGASRSTLGPLAVMACGLIRSDFYIYIYIHTRNVHVCIWTQPQRWSQNISEQTYNSNAIAKSDISSGVRQVPWIGFILHNLLFQLMPKTQSHSNILSDDISYAISP
jgi:hypothetical protein